MTTQQSIPPVPPIRRSARPPIKAIAIAATAILARCSPHVGSDKVVDLRPYTLWIAVGQGAEALKAQHRILMTSPTGPRIPEKIEIITESCEYIFCNA